MGKLKILILSDYSFIKGGSEKVAILEATGLADKGHEVVFFSAVGPTCKELISSPVKRIICLNQKDILDNKNKIDAIFSGIYNYRAVKKLNELLSEWLPDIVHLHGLSKALSWAPVRKINSLKIPIIYTLHDYGLICPNLGIYNFKKEENCPYYKPGDSLKCLSTNCDKRNYLQKIWRWIRFQTVIRVYKINKKVNGYIAVSNFLQKMIKNSLSSSKQIRTIYNPIETDEYKGSYKSNIKRENFIFIGRLSREKGIDLLLEAIEKVEASLTIIGDGELAPLIVSAQKELGSKKINFMGYKNKNVIYEEMKKSIALILPSRCMEPAPLVIGEAAYNYLPSIVADHGGLTEFIKNRVSGIHFKAGDVDSLIRSMNYFISEPEMTEELGLKAHEIIKTMGLNLDNHLDKIEQYYNNILKNL